MSNFIPLRLILQENKPNLAQFLQKLNEHKLQKRDLNLLLRKAIESKLPQFGQFIDALIRVRKGADINFFDSKGKFEIMLVVQQIDNVSNLMLACEKGTYNMVKTLLQYKELDLRHKDSRQLHAGFYAVQNKRAQQGENILKILIEREQALVNQEAGNQTLLTAAIRRGKSQLVKLLLQNGADPNWQVPDTGNSFLHDAVKQIRSKLSKSNSEIIRLLLLYGANTNLKNKQQKTVEDYAERTKEEYKKILESVENEFIERQQRVVPLLSINSAKEREGLLAEAYSIFSKYEEDQEQGEEFVDEEYFVDNLTREIEEYQKECKREYEHAQKEIKKFMDYLSLLAEQRCLSVEMIGSFATGLWIRQSNIDIQLIRTQKMLENLPKTMLEELGDKLQKRELCKTKPILSATRPKLKCQIKHSKGILFVTISICYPNSGPRDNVVFLQDQISRYPELVPLFLVLKTLTSHYKLCDSKTGGIRTYALAIMLLSCISTWNKTSLGKFLIDFLFYFGFYYDYIPIISEMGIEDDCLALHIIDPLNHSTDLGNKVNAAALQKMFRTAYIILHSNHSKGKLPLMFETKKIMQERS